MGLAASQRASLVCVIENNQWAYSTPVSRQVPARDLADRAKAYGVASSIVDGNDVVAVYQTTKEAVEFCETDRGGDITYHGPGQIVGYPIVKLSEIRRDVGWYVRQLEEAMIRTTAEFGLTAGRLEGMTGIWVDAAGADQEKLGAIGVHLSRWVTSHGFAYNVSTDLRYFDLIVPCGLNGKRATSLEKLLGRAVQREDVASRMVGHFGDVLNLEMHAATREQIEQSYGALNEVSAHA